MTERQHFDEMFGHGDTARETYAGYHQWFSGEDTKRLITKAHAAEVLFRRTGITFTVYGDGSTNERLIPFDIVPRIIGAIEWARLEKGVVQRVRALNAFLHDLYNRQEILRAGRVPSALIERNDAFVPQMIGVTPPGGVYTHIVGIDLVRTSEDEFFVLEDNARTPSGVSYMLENRETMLHLFPELFSRQRVRRVNDYSRQLRRSLAACAPQSANDTPTVAVLTPGVHNSAFFEHSFLADEMGVELVEGHDLEVRDGHLMMRTTSGYEQIDVLYRRVDDEFLDPLNFNPDSLLGTPGVMDVHRAGNLTIANAPGTGIADDKAIYSYVPTMIDFYLGETPILNNVETWRCSDPDSLSYVQQNLADLVVKEVHGSGGYGMLVGPAASRRELADFATKLASNPSNYIAQPTLSLSTVPILTDAGLAPRHVDLRPFALVAPDEVMVTPGGLTRVALTEGSLVVNSSQGGGTKDTWVLED